LFVDETSPIYHVVYSAGTGTVLLAIARISGIALRRHLSPYLTLLASLLTSCGLGMLIWNETGWPSVAMTINLLEGFWLLNCAIILGASAPYLEKHQQEQAICLTLLWAGQCMFRWEFLLHIENESWIKLNLWLPFLLPFTAFMWIGMRARDRFKAVVPTA
jgi:hypothetical protein